VAVVDDRGQPVSGARVAGRYSTQPNELSCTTAADGRCAVSGVAVPWGAVPSITFAVTGLSGADLVDSGAGLRRAQVAQPVAPVVSALELGGTMVRATPSAAAWTPRFTVTLRDERGAAVPGAWVQAQITVHAGASAVGLQVLGCQTAANGQCPLAWGGPTLNASHTGAKLRVIGVSRPFLTVRPGPLPEMTVGRVR
jgi:hypothetical protein